MQKWCLKIVAAGLLFFGTSPLLAQPAVQLQRADSLFANRQFTQSHTLYQELWAQHHYSPAMLLRLAYIEEGLGHTARSLYYLNMHYLLTHDEGVHTHMQEVAQRNRLQGYETSSADKLLSLLHRYAVPLQVALAAVALFCLALMVRQQRQGSRPIGSFAALACTLLLLLGVGVYPAVPAHGIVTQAPVYVMSGPSSGAKVEAILTSGHRLQVAGRHDVWLKVNWQGHEAYVKESQVLPVGL